MPPPMTLKNKLARLAIAIVVLAIIAYFAFPFVGSYTSLRAKVDQVRIARLQGWAVSVLDNPPQFHRMSGPMTGAPIQPPEDLRSLGGNVSYQFPDTGDAYIRFDYGSYGNEYALAVGRLDFFPPVPAGFNAEKIADGIWIIHQK